jgi:putative tryptophan/tyrosine transport system substrate-binding protein
MSDMRRRDFITLLGGAAAGWPLAAGAQQPATPVIGVLHPRSHTEAITALAALRRGLREIGFVEGENLAIEYRFADGQPARLPSLAADVIQRRMAVIVAGARGGEAAKTATTTIPIVFLSGGDPIRTGLIANLNRPGGNLTGVSWLSLDMEAKRLGLLRDWFHKPCPLPFSWSRLVPQWIFKCSGRRQRHAAPACRFGSCRSAATETSTLLSWP